MFKSFIHFHRLVCVLSVMRAPWISCFFFAFFLVFSSNIVFASWPKPGSNYTHRFIPTPSANGNDTNIHYPPDTQQPFPTADLSTTWTNDESSMPSINFTDDGSKIRVILDQDRFACGFFCNGNCTSYLFVVVIKLFYTPDYIFGTKGINPTVIWSANRDYPVSQGATVNLTAAGELVLQDVDGSIVWTTNTTRKSVSSMNLTDNGNLMLLDANNSISWQSFDHPTDCLVAGQKLFQGHKLIPSVSSTNWTAQKGSYYLQLTDRGLFAYVESKPPQVYYQHLINGKNTINKESIYVELLNGSVCFFNSSTKLDAIDIPQEFPLEYIKLMPDGHLKAFGGKRVADLLIDYDFGECSYPLVCGRNSICSANIQCSCPKSSSPSTEYFRAVDDSQPNKGCSQVTPLTCNSTKDQHFIEVKNIKYFTYTGDMVNVDMETCKQACMNNCSCKAAIFVYQSSNSSSGYCDLPSDLFTMTKFDVDVNNQLHASAFIKVQNRRHKSPNRLNQVEKVIGFTVGSLLLLLVVVGFTMSLVKKKKMDSEIEEEHLDQVTGMPTRFSYKELKTATENFSKKLGEGGFGSVFEGTLEDGSRVAVKCLHNVGLMQVKKSFLAEVESIGSIHHVNLVRLRGFCAWKSERLLVYDFMSNGSLDQWIYYGDRKHVLKWECRKKIILDIAKGLAYLHEECRQKIIHLDIKPQNILLDKDFNAKVSDFGLSKLIDRNQSQVITTMRGTPGYLAPEWLSSIITEKVDVYSFGIVLLEILCGRKNFDRSQPEECWHLLDVFQRCWDQGALLDIVDSCSDDMHVHGNEVMEMMKVASWCLQTDFTKRPSMSTVIKVFEGVMNVESDLDYNFLYPRQQKATDEYEKYSMPLLPSILSGPR
ncbi:G-type lectin S-receptor-like serine/threonine-protein kinase SD2-5 [Lactuca sativa]|uniref:G-type lectin S-receptor-like serine/threonine-protein kinase SD2-5 n=1 Tax=Lactuca sativa TaxID=4236 RepID=UPI000CD8BEAA|nr:G-type lectin S-receptor-like serine/threonine-protein kinase SD2-5 [Lactuca sativa]